MSAFQRQESAVKVFGYHGEEGAGSLPCIQGPATFSGGFGDQYLYFTLGYQSLKILRLLYPRNTPFNDFFLLVIAPFSPLTVNNPPKQRQHA